MGAIRIVLVVCALALAPEACAQTLADRYFVVVWAFEGPTSSVFDSHTFASFYRGEDLARGIAREATISWLPATGVVRPTGPRKGKNFTFEETMALARERKAIVKSYGPYEITADTYRNALARIRQLNDGELSYTMINWLPFAVNCIAAVSEVNGPLRTWWRWGFEASMMVARHLAIEYPKVDPQAAAALRAGSAAEIAANPTRPLN